VTDTMGELAAQRTRLEVLRSGLGAQLASVRTAAGISQPQLGQVLERTRSFISKVEHGVRRMPAQLWKIADELCDADGALITAHAELIQAEQDHRARRRATRHQRQPTSVQLDIRHEIWPTPARLGSSSCQDVVWPPETLVSGQLAQELMTVVTKLARLIGRRQAIQLAGSVLAAVGLSDLDIDEYTRVAQAVDSPRRIDARVIDNFMIMLTVCKRQEDTLGPREVLDTVRAQHAIVRRLIRQGDCPDKLHKPLHLVDSTMAATIGGYLNNMLQPEAASRYFAHARKAAHHAAPLTRPSTLASQHSNAATHPPH
jgi:transcriptional regulator with XRE-family HTH domain